MTKHGLKNSPFMYKCCFPLSLFCRTWTFVRSDYIFCQSKHFFFVKVCTNLLFIKNWQFFLQTCEKIYPLALRANPATVPGVKLVRLVKLVKLDTPSISNKPKMDQHRPQNRPKIDPKSSQNRPKIDQKSTKIDQKSSLDGAWVPFGPQGGSGSRLDPETLIRWTPWAPQVGSQN